MRRKDELGKDLESFLLLDGRKEPEDLHLLLEGGLRQECVTALEGVCGLFTCQDREGPYTNAFLLLWLGFPRQLFENPEAFPEALPECRIGLIRKMGCENRSGIDVPVFGKLQKPSRGGSSDLQPFIEQVCPASFDDRPLLPRPVPGLKFGHQPFRRLAFRVGL